MSKTAGQTTGTQAASKPAPRPLAKVVSLDEARHKLRSPRPCRPRQPRRSQTEALDLTESALNRLTPEARRAYRDRVDRYARGLIKRASGLSEVESNKSDARIAFKHIKIATRMTSSKPTAGGFGLGFALDVSLTLGAGLIGALCARPDLLSGSGYLLLAIGVSLAVGAFIAREAWQAAV